MNKNEAEAVIKDTIEYANNEIKKNKVRSRNRVLILFGCMLLLVISYLMIFKYEIYVGYADNLIDVKVPEDGGLDIKINLPNYNNADAIWVKTDDNSYDLYINVTQTILTKIAKSGDESDNLLRVGNGMIVDFKSETVLGYIPDGNSAENIMHVYYIDKLSNEIMCMDNSELINYEKKTLIWTR